MKKQKITTTNEQAGAPDAEELLLGLSSGKELSEEDIAGVVTVLSATDSEALIRCPNIDDVYSYLVVLKKAELYELRHLIEQYLNAEDPLTVALALEILCLDWKGTEEYLEQVIHFALGVVWDQDEDVRQMAVKILGEYLFARFDKQEGIKSEDIKEPEQRVLGLLLNTFEDKEIDQWTRQVAYSALCRVYGKSWEDIPPECALLDFTIDSEDIDKEILFPYLYTFFPQGPFASGPERSNSGSNGKSSSGKVFSGIR